MHKSSPMSVSSHDAIVAPSMIGSWERLPATQGALTYGFGWENFDYGGETLISHDGGVDSFQSFIGYLPGREWGVVLMSNIASPGLEVLTWYLIDEYLELPSCKRANLTKK